MRKLCIVLLMGFVFVINLYANYGWPLKDFDVQHQIIGTFGEYRTGHFHSAVDINAPESTMVWNIETDTCYISGSGINIGHFRYFHLAGFRVDNLSLVSAGDSIAKTDSANHVHLMESRTEIKVYGDPANVWWLEPLRSGALTPFIDSVSPTIYWTRFYEKDTGGVAYGDSISSDSLQGRIDILSSAGDMRTDSTGHSAGGNCSIYRIGYLVKDTLGNIVKPYWEKIKFDSVYNHKDTSRLNRTYGPGSATNIFRYWVTNDPFNDTTALRNWYWNTKQQAGQPDSVDADSIEDAKFKDGSYWVKVIASDIGNNADSESVYVQVGNFRPEVRETEPDDGETDVPLNQHIYIRFSEPMDRGVNLWSAISISPGVSGDWEWLSSTEIEFTPDPSFVESTTYTVSLSSQIKDLQGQELIPYNFSFTTGTGPGPQGYPTRFQWEDVTGWDVSVSWFDNYYTFQIFWNFSFPFYGYGYDMIIFNRRGSIWFDTNRDWCNFDLPTAGGSGQPVMAVYNDSLRHLWGHYSRGRSRELSNPNREVVRWTYTYYADTTEFEAVLFADGTIRFDYRKCDIDTFFDNDGGSGISNGDGVNYSSITENYGPVYELAPASFIFTTNPPPGRPKDLVANWPIRSEFVNLSWRLNPEPDLKGYNIYRRHSDSLNYKKLDSTSINNYTDTLVQLGNTYIYRAAALDTFNLESAYSDSVLVKYGPREVDNPLATAYNNASRIIRNPSTSEIFLAYTSGDNIFSISSYDEGISWGRSELIAPGQFPTLVLDSENNPCCLFGRWIGPSGFGSAQLYYTRYIDNHWAAPALLMSVDSVYIGIPEYAIPAPSASVDSQDTIHVTWMSPMGQEHIHRFAVWYGNLYAFDTIPVFNYVQLDTIWVYESSPCPTLAIDGQEIVHVVYETDPAAPTLFYRYRESGIWVEKEAIESGGCYYPDLEFFGDRIHLVWDYRYPDTTVAHELHYRSKSTTGWDTIMNIYEPLPFNVFGEPVNAGGWYTVWADQDIYYSRFDGTTWQEPEPVQVTPLLSAHPTAMFRQDLDDTCLYIAWTEGDSAPYTIQFEKITVPSVPRSYANLGQPVQSPYCLERDGYWIFGDKPYESVDYDNDSLVYKFSDLDLAKEYRLDLAYYFEANPPRYSPPPLSSPFKGEGIIDCTSLIKGKGMSEKVSATNHCSDLKCPTDEIISPPAAHHSDHAGDESEKGIGRLIQALVIDGVRLDSAFIVPHKLVRVSIWLPNELYADGEIITEIEKIKGKVVVCGEIALYEFEGGEEKGSIANMLGGPQSNEIMHVNPIFFQGLYPNPAKGDLKVKFNSPDEREVTVKLYDVTGRLINEFFNGKLKVGTNEIPIRSKKLAAGVYFIRIDVGKDIITVKVIMLK